MSCTDAELLPTSDDGAVLRAVRAFLMDDDAIHAVDSDEDASMLVPLPGYASSASDSSGSTSQSPVAAATPVTTGPPARPRSINRSRVRRLNEIATLRQKVIALEHRITEIKHGDDSTGGPSGTLSSRAWQNIALNHLGLLESAEAERETLKETIAHYKETIKRVRRFLYRQIHKHSQMMPLIQTTSLSRRAALDLDDTARGFQDVSQYLESMHAQLDSVFQDSRLELDRVTGQLQDLRIQNDDSINMSLEYVESRLLPFDVDTTAKAVWYYHSAKASEVALEQEIMDSENVLRRSFLPTMQFPNSTGKVRGRVEVRRYVDKDRVVILQCTIFHRTSRSGGGSIDDGYGIRVLNWTVVGPPRNDRLRTMDRPLSHVDVFEMVVPFFPEGTTQTSQDREALKAFCVDTTKFMHAFERQAVENFLLDGTNAT